MSSRRGGRRSGPQNADLSNPVNLEMLSAYTVNAGSAAPSEADKTFLNKRNKNQKKREMQAQKQQEAAVAEEKRKSESKDGDEEEDGEADNWEDNWDAASDGSDDTPAPPEFVIDQDAVEERRKAEEAAKREEEVAAKKAAAAAEKSAKKQQQQQNKKKAGTPNKQQQSQHQKAKSPVPKRDPRVESALKSLGGTVDEVSSLFQTLGLQQPNNSDKKSVAVRKPEASFSKDDVKAEREAKKKAKQEAKTTAAAKKEGGGSDSKSVPNKSEEVKSEPSAVVTSQKDNHPNNEGGQKSKDEIKAEREAKKKAKQAARAAAKEGGGEKPGPDQQKPQPTAAAAGAAGGEPSSAAPQKSKAELRRERRELQEQQRAAKESAEAKSEAAGKKADGGKKSAPGSDASSSRVPPSKPEKPSKGQRVPDDIQADRVSVEKKLQKNLASQNLPQRPKAQRKVMLFSHLHQYERELSISRDLPVVGGHIHPAIVQLGLQYAEGAIQGSNARCIAFMTAMKRVISDYTTPEDREMSRDLDAKLKTHVTFLKGCRNHSTSMGNAIRFLKAKIRKVSAGTAENEAKEGLIEAIDRFVHDIHLSAVQISITACEKIRDGDVILTYGCSSLLQAVFSRAAASGLKFRVIVADGRPKLEGRQMAHHLTKAGVDCTYTMVHSLSYVIGEVTKVFLGAHAVMANGYVMSRVGTSQVAMIAKAQNVPVLVCCETYKFSERVQTDSFVFNELGDPDDLVATGTDVSSLEDWRDLSALNLLYLNYDVTPASLVDAIITEISVIPCTSVPVVLRLKAIDLGQ